MVFFPGFGLLEKKWSFFRKKRYIRHHGRCQQAMGEQISWVMLLKGMYNCNWVEWLDAWIGTPGAHVEHLNWFVNGQAVGLRDSSFNFTKLKLGSHWRSESLWPVTARQRRQQRWRLAGGPAESRPSRRPGRWPGRLTAIPRHGRSQFSESPARNLAMKTIHLPWKQYIWYILQCFHTSCQFLIHPMIGGCIGCINILQYTSVHPQKF